MVQREDDEFGNLLRQHRERIGFTQRELSERTSVSARTIGYLEANRTRPRHDTIHLLSEALELGGVARAQFEAAARGWRIVPQESAAPLGNLPLALNSFIGRQADIATISASFTADPPQRLVTLTGTGGAGKTRLALQVARVVADEYPDGCWLISLETCTTPQQLPRTLTTAFRLRERRGQSLMDLIKHWVHDRTTLILLDNCEHVLEASARLAQELLQVAPNLTILATSRVPLRIAGEQVWRVPSLSLPTGATTPAPESVALTEAAQLFADRAAANSPGFAITADNAAEVAQLCLRLDGLPLALELAAAQLPAIALGQLVARLDRVFEVLTEGSRVVLARHQTLLATLEWSYNLLREPERVVLRRLAVFTGGFTLEGAEAVCAAADLSGAAIMPLLAQLVHQSLVQAEDRPDGTKRYRLLETIRQFADTLLAQHAEGHACRQRHCAFYTSLAERVPYPLDGGAIGAGWFDQLSAEMPNIDAALLWASEHDALLGLRLASAIWPKWYLRETRTTGRMWLQDLLTRAGATPALRARALYGLGFLCIFDDSQIAIASLEEALALAEQLPDRALSTAIRYPLTYMYITTGALAAAQAQVDSVWNTADGAPHTSHPLMRGLLALSTSKLQEARDLLTIARDMGTAAKQPLLLAVTLNWLCDTSLKLGEFARAAAESREASAVATAIGFTFYQYLAQYRLGQLLERQGQLPEAEMAYRECLHLTLQRGGNRLEEFFCYRGLGQIAIYQRRYGQAREQLAEAARLMAHDQDLRKSRELAYLEGLARWHGEDRSKGAALLAQGLTQWLISGDQVGIAGYLESLAALAVETTPLLAARWLGAAAAIREATQASRPPVEDEDYEATRASTMAKLGKSAFTTAWGYGRDTDLSITVDKVTAWLAEQQSPNR